MKKVKLAIFITMCMSIFAFNHANAIVGTPKDAQHAGMQQSSPFVNAENTTVVTPKEMKFMEKIQKRYAKMQAKKLNSNMSADESVTFTDPVEKWLWFGLLGIAAGIVLPILKLSTLGYLAGLVGVVCLAIWVYKRFLS